MFMYDCGTAPALHHIGNDMHGAIVIDPPDLAPVEHEYVLVQSEIARRATGTGTIHHSPTGAVTGVAPS